jgi:hypothetical protein
VIAPDPLLLALSLADRILGPDALADLADAIGWDLPLDWPDPVATFAPEP